MMTPSTPDDACGPAFDKLWALVAPDRSFGGDRVLWSPEDHAWRASDPWGPGFLAGPAPSAEPDPQYLAAATALLESAGEYCPHDTRRRPGCGLKIAGDHFVAPDVTGAPAVYPDPAVVDASGGRGAKKHWGSQLGCHFVKPKFWTDARGDEHAWYGNGLVASEVRDRAWCSKCEAPGDQDAMKRAEQAERKLLSVRASDRRRRAWGLDRGR